ncbi:MAG: TIGR04283 family arsenosugar biosynthesis glycosyltransferase [bacterium]
MKPKLSIIIPVLNEEETLRLLLRDIKICERSLPFSMECIVVDGESVDNSVEVCKEFGVKVIKASRGRGQQLCAGAQQSKGEVLFFLHADSRLTPEHCLAAVATVSNNGIVAGGFELKFDDSHPILKFAEWVNKIRFRYTRIFYGDHGIFTQRKSYEEVGGIPPQALFEDVEFSRRLKKQGRVVMTSPCMMTSSRRFRAGGVIRTYLKMAFLYILHWLRVSPDYLARLYQKKSRPVKS